MPTMDRNRAWIASDAFLRWVEAAYADDCIPFQRKRYQEIVDRFRDLFGKSDACLFSTPGRVEIGGNHTDHNHGLILAASIRLDAVAAAARNDSNRVVLHSEGYSEPFIVDLNRLEPLSEEGGSTSALIRGIAGRLEQLGFRTGGFDAYVQSDVLPGSGLSSSAVVEMLIVKIFDTLFNEDGIDVLTLAKIGQYAENVYFGKPCGLMDQIACSMGGIVHVDFGDTEKPAVRKVRSGAFSEKYRIVVVNTGGSHADLTDAYAAVPAEMKAVAHELGAEFCREISWPALLDRMRDLRVSVGDRAILRAMHFLMENERVKEQVESLENNDVVRFLRLVKESGDSSFKWLQNIIPGNEARHQGIPLALVMTEAYCAEIGDGASRVHGGGFAGTILVVLPREKVNGYIHHMKKIFDEKDILALGIRETGLAVLGPDKIVTDPGR